MHENFEKSMNYGQYLKNLIPSVITMIFLSFYTTIDGFFVSRYAGSDALAGINIVIPITCVIFGVAVMLATGAGAIIGIKLGNKEERHASQIFSLVSLALLIFSVVFTVLGIVYLEPVAVFLGSSEILMEYVLPYAFMIFIGTIPMAFKLFFEYMVRSDGSPEVGMRMSTVGLVLNIVLDYVFVGLLGLGTLGAGIGTTLSITASGLIGLNYFLRHSQISFCRPKADWMILWGSCTNGSSEMLTEFSTGITTLLFNLMIMKECGEDGVAAVTIIMYIYYFFIAFFMGISVGTAPIISYNIGSGNYRKIEETLKYGFGTVTAFSILIFTITWVAGRAIIGIFITGGHVFDLTWDALRVFSPVFLLIGFNVFLSGYFTALGKGLISAVISSLRSLILVVFFLMILPPLIGINGIWAAMPLAEAVTVVLAFELYAWKGNDYRVTLL